MLPRHLPPKRRVCVNQNLPAIVVQDVGRSLEAIHQVNPMEDWKEVHIPLKLHVLKIDVLIVHLRGELRPQLPLRCPLLILNLRCPRGFLPYCIGSCELISNFRSPSPSRIQGRSLSRLRLSSGLRFSGDFLLCTFHVRRFCQPCRLRLCFCCFLALILLKCLLSCASFLMRYASRLLLCRKVLLLLLFLVLPRFDPALTSLICQFLSPCFLRLFRFLQSVRRSCCEPLLLLPLLCSGRFPSHLNYDNSGGPCPPERPVRSQTLPDCH
mmetsp:Transcript_60097/g.123426  ORF Transcript_60097/g.123426 Transcript_60097/m.123426 type:complete len:268 (+) Transcript_60097:417-1220(+)